ncbi:TOM6 protein, partial [Centropus bengalensis]|nr:TOM6 protein [Centropus bengalensis]
MAAAAAGGVGAGSGAGPVAGPAGRGLRGWLRSAYRFATDRNDFRRNLLVNLGLFAAGVWVARNLTDIDLMAPQPSP